ncbi:tryptophan transporter [Bacillus sp. FJAT-47783]|uniref:tryptophan transporter n=1 Tax=Bacillus sp. FJAT-47783 TaxID=2922712 RepID=UPI001FAB67CA|nr:tryptophan transporter [Bacillus sp. FJAT-47783]
MNTRVLVSLSLFVAIGAALHGIIPPIFNGMKPDMMLLMMFLGIILFPGLKNSFILGIVTGFLSGLTSSFPGGFVPNIIDKVLTSIIVYVLYVMLKRFVKASLSTLMITAFGTMISGVIFLTSALTIVGLPGGVGFLPLFVGVVLPATVLNTIAMVIIYPIVQSILRRSHFISVSN